MDNSKRYEEYLRTELEAAAMYSALAKLENDPDRASIFEELVEAEMRHAGRWASKLGIDPSGLSPAPLGVQGRLLHIGARLFGTRRVLPIMLRLEAKETDAYMADPEARDLVPEERKHSRILRGLSDSDGISNAGSRVLGASGNLRAAVLGVNDGLLSNFSLVMGVAGGTNNTEIILLAGVAGLLAGAFSMAAGEYVSMRSQRDIFENELLKEEIELREWPEEERKELVLIYRAKGLSENEATTIADRVMSDPAVALDTMAREELGLDPSELGSPWGAAASSFTAFVVGAIVPILPYLSNLGERSFMLSAIFSASALVLIGGLLSSLSGRSPWRGSLRMLLAGSAAAAVTYAVGNLVGSIVTI